MAELTLLMESAQHYRCPVCGHLARFDICIRRAWCPACYLQRGEREQPMTPILPWGVDARQ